MWSVESVAALEEHLTVTQFKVAQEQQRLEDVTAQIAQTEQALGTAQAAVEKKQKELQSLQKQTKEQRTAALTVQGNPLYGEKDDHRQYHSDPHPSAAHSRIMRSMGFLPRRKTAA